MVHAINIHSAHVNPTQEISKSVKTEKIDIAIVYKHYEVWESFDLEEEV